MYALIQNGHTIFGVGETPEAARADAITNNGDEDGGFSAAVVRRNMGAVRFNHVDGDLIIAPCTDALAASVIDDGVTTCGENTGGHLCLISEQS